MNVAGKHITVIGAAKSGVGAACLLANRGARVLVTDSGSIPEAYKSILTRAGIRFEENGHSAGSYEADFAVASPGVPDEAPLMQHFLSSGKGLYSEIEAASWFSSSPIVAITGSNGKTTVTSWLGHLWETAGVSAKVGGNIGTAFSGLVDQTQSGDWTILEISSFQLDHIHSFRPKISCILNITPDHLNRYQYKFENYAASKMRIMENQQSDDVFICWNEDAIVGRLLGSLSRKNLPQIWRFSIENEVEQGAFVRENKIFFKINNQEEYLMHIEEIGLKGRHNLQNGLAVALAARAAEIRVDAIRESLMKFEGVEHRLEQVRTLDGVKYINDSKATNVNAVWYALDSIKVPMVLILGGRDKGNDYSELEDQIRQKVHTIIAIGEGKDSIRKQLADHVPNFRTAESMEEAVRESRRVAKRGEVVLLSPACASFDMFENYEHRGREFKKYVNQL